MTSPQINHHAKALLDVSSASANKYGRNQMQTINN